MSARLEIGGERYVIEQGQVRPDDAKDQDPVHQARARHLSTAGPEWVDQARRDHTLDAYDPDTDCTLARIIARHIHGRYTCDPSTTPEPGQVF
jgi:hypothetical protein